MNEDLITVWIKWPSLRIQQYIDTKEGVPVEFVLQLEYNMNPDLADPSSHDWRQVARFDHEHGGAHDVRNEGLHMDLYKEGHKERIARDFPSVEITKAPQYCYDYLRERRDDIVEHFERIHGIEPSESIMTP